MNQRGPLPAGFWEVPSREVGDCLCVYCEIGEGCEGTVIRTEPGTGIALSAKIREGWGMGWWVDL